MKAMALTRKFLKALGIEDDKIDEIVSAHGETVTALKAEIDEAKQGASGLDAVTKERDRYKADLEALQKTSGDAAKVQAEYDAYKAQVDRDKTAAKKGAALDAVLKKAGVERESFRAQLRKGWDMDTVELEESGGVKDEAALLSRIKADYPDFIGTVNTEGTKPLTPPAGGGKTYTRDQLKGLSAEEINANWGAVSAALKGD